MTDLFDLIGYQCPPAVNPDSPKCDDDDPAYITPPLGKAKPHHEPEPDINVDDSGDRPEESQKSTHQIYIKGHNPLKFADGLLPLTRMLAATDLIEFADHMDELQANIIYLCDEIHLRIVNDGIVTPELTALQDELKKALPIVTDGDRPNDSPKDEKSSSVAIEEAHENEKASLQSTATHENTRKSYIEEKTFTNKRGKKSIYLYERWRENGKRKSKYLRKKISESRDPA